MNASVGSDAETARRQRLVALLGECADRHESALAELYELCAAQLFGILLRILKIEAVAEEALQESFIKIWDNAGHYDASVSAPTTWMTRIARNQALDVLRRRSSREDHEIPELVTLIDTTASLEKPVELMNEDAQALMHCLEALKPPARDCIVKACCEGYSHEELSTQHGTALGTVKSWIRRGLLALRSCIDDFA